MADDNATPEPSNEKAPETTSEVPEDSGEKLDQLEQERDKLNQQAGSDEKLPVTTEGDKDKDAQDTDSRALIKERASVLRAQREAATNQEKVQKEQKKAAEAQRGTAEQNELVKTKQGAFGEVEGFKPKYKADADGDTYETIKPASPWKKWVHRN